MGTEIECLADGHILVIGIAVTGARSVHGFRDASMRSNHNEMRRDE